MIFNPYVNDFRAKDETGTPEVILNGTNPPSSSLVSWVAHLNPITLKSKETKTIDVTISVPIGAEPGGHYGVVRFSGIAPSLQQTGVALAASAGTLVLVRVSGNIKEALDLKEFFTESGSRRTGLFETGPITFVERINNIGNVHVKPVGNLIVKNMFGKSIGSLKINAESGNILPSSIRRFEQTLNKKWLFGRFTASQSLAYGTSGQVLMGSIAFWVIPYKLILIILAALGLLIWLVIKLIKRYNQAIVDRAMQNRQQDGQ